MSYRSIKEFSGYMLIIVGVIIVSGTLLALGATYSNPTKKEVPKDEQSILLKTRMSVLKLSNMEGTSGGSGVSVKGLKSKEPRVLTNYHVCDSFIKTGLKATGVTGSTILSVLYTDPKHDLCILTGIGVPTLDLAETPAKYYDTIYNVGHPFLQPATPAVGRMLEREITPINFSPDEKGECADHQTKESFLWMTFCVQPMEVDGTTVRIYPGNSGSPAVNSNGDIVGLFNSGDGRTAYGNIIPLEHIKDFLKDK